MPSNQPETHDREEAGQECEVTNCPYRADIGAIRGHDRMLASHDAQLDALRETIRNMSDVSKGQTSVLQELVVSVQDHHSREAERAAMMIEQTQRSDERNARGRWILGLAVSVVSLIAAYHVPITTAIGRLFGGHRG